MDLVLILKKKRKLHFLLVCQSHYLEQLLIIIRITYYTLFPPMIVLIYEQNVRNLDHLYEQKVTYKSSEKRKQIWFCYCIIENTDVLQVFVDATSVL